MYPKIKPRMNIVTLGHHQCGKSTAMGHLVYKMKAIDEKAIEKFKKESKEMGRASYYYAWVLDQSQEERERGMSINLNQWSFEGQKFSYTLFDVPGSSSYTTNAIAGMPQADVGLLFVSAVPNEFDEGMSRKGQTFEHALLAFMMGVRSLVVVVTKMDCVNYSKARFDEISSAMKNLVKKVGFRYGSDSYNNFRIFPISGLHGDNVDDVSTNMPWFKFGGPRYLTDFFNADDGSWLRNISSKRDEYGAGKPLRVLINNAYDITDIGTVATGHVVTGTILPGDIVQFSPSGLQAKVEFIEVHSEAMKKGVTGDQIGFNVPSLSVKDIHRGMVAFHANNSPAPVVKSFVAQLSIIAVYGDGAIYNGFEFVVHCGTAHVACKLEHISKKINRKGVIIEENPDSVKVGDNCIVTMVPKDPVCMESYMDCSYLGRITVRHHNMTAAVGVIKSVVE
eukprot:CAMPEP_0196805648 /NCGR_PEP_ID=MMETSP1362-20130617/5444_1 /TAXON_ID=163516 /ORGANISM="Leptocylindrus danicus, Strain CCMP1856" /LENGTH=449 /DNA_ID=CAMNT_0042178695 /DNA_START=32 /DNA_END=1381 /DNA_ORIENTATION=-